MYIYHAAQWICFFYIYCLLGWIWESTYVSVKDRKLINRGFLYGPWLPIYGSGAICILFATLPFKENLFLIFLLGAIMASILEYFTGTAMETMFKVRYWDYSSEPLNLNGYICLKCSLVWGIFSILLVRVLHNPLEAMVLAIDDQILTVITHLLTILFTIDLVLSFRNAFDLRQMLENITDISEDAAKLQRRLDAAIAFFEEDKKEFTEKVDATKEKLEESITRQYQRVLNLQHEAAERLLSLKSGTSSPETTAEKLETLKAELSQISSGFHEYKIKMELQKRDKKRLRNVFSGNPTAAAPQKYQKAFEYLKDSLKK